jgi:DNA-binding PadR family transcriptional regulator
MYRFDISGRAPSRRGASRRAILGLLSVGPMSGYDIRQLVGAGLSHFWRMSYGSIYPTLGRLTREGLVRRRVKTGRAGSTRFVYSLTEKGARFVDDWLAEPSPDEPPVQSEFLLKVFLGARGGRSVVGAELERFRRRQSDLLAQLSEAEKLIASGPRTEAGFYWRLTLDRGVRVARARREWAQDALESIGGLPDRTPGEAAPAKSVRARRARSSRQRQGKEPS